MQCVGDPGQSPREEFGKTSGEEWEVLELNLSSAHVQSFVHTSLFLLALFEVSVAQITKAEMVFRGDFCCF